MNFLKIREIIEQISHLAQLVEIGFEKLTPQNIQLLKEYIHCSPLPVILKPLSKQSKNEYLQLISLSATLIPSYIDIEIGSVLTKKETFGIIEKIKHEYPSIKIILSYHNPGYYPEDLDFLYHSFQHRSIHFYKIAVHVTNAIQALKILNYSKNKRDLIALGMGPHGRITRILSPIVNNPINYCCIDASHPIAPGQIALNELINTFGYLNLSEKTSVYCLIGNPTQQSISHITHNYFFQRQNVDAVYVKIDVSPEELPLFIEEAKKIPLKGISVTTPLKKIIGELLSPIKSLPINTLRYEALSFVSKNTDGLGAISALNSPQNKRVAVIGGTGGAGIAIVQELCHRNNNVTIITRNPSWVPQFSLSVKIRDFSDDSICNPYDILINCSPADFPLPIHLLKADSVVMDIKMPSKMTLFISEAQKMGYKIIQGSSLFAYQALEQFKFWNLPIESFEQHFIDKVTKVIDSCN